VHRDMEIDKKLFRNLFPILRLRWTKNSAKYLHASLADNSDGLRYRHGRLVSNDTDLVDLLRKCRNLPEAIELISYQEKGEEIIPADAQALRFTVEKKGIEAFGPAKDQDLDESQELRGLRRCLRIFNCKSTDRDGESY